MSDLDRLSRRPLQIAWWRIVLSGIAVLVCGSVEFGTNVADTLVSGRSAAMQLKPSDPAYMQNLLLQHGFSGMTVIPAVVLLIILAVIWWAPVRRAMMASLIAAWFLASLPAQAYYDKSNYAEPVFILPNESAFFIPDVGDNKNTQASFGSEEYLQANKIAAKRFEIPHAKLSGSGLWSDFYVPSGRLIIVDRTPFSREWVEPQNRGTSVKNEAFPCQTMEGLDLSVGIAIGASVFEQNAARFLYRFGVNPPQGDRTRPEVIFTSVYYGRSLREVMDGPVRSKVQSLVCAQVASRSFDDANRQANQMMTAIQADAVAYLNTVGITLDYIGWADTFTFDKTVQDAVNRRYIATQDKAIADLLAPHAAVIQQLAVADALRNKWDGKVPSSVSLWLTSNLGDLLGSIMRPGTTR